MSTSGTSFAVSAVATGAPDTGFRTTSSRRAASAEPEPPGRGAVGSALGRFDVRVMSVFGKGVVLVLRTIAKVIHTWEGGKPAGEDQARRLNEPPRGEYRP